MSSKPHAPGTSPLSPASHSDPSLQEEIMLPSDEFWEEHKTKIIGAVVLVLVLAFAFIAWKGIEEKKRSEAMTAFANASQPEQWRAVMDQFPGTPAAQNSGLLLAAALRDQGDLPASDLVYNELLSAKKTFALQSAAALGLAQNQILRSSGGNIDEAVSSLQSVATGYPGEYTAAYALYTEGDLLLSAGREEDAIRIFRNLLTDYPASLPGRMASMQLQNLAPAAEPAAATAPAQN